MRKEEKAKYLEAQTIGYISACNGLEIKDVNDEYMILVSNAWSGGKKSVHKLKVYSNGENLYINFHGYRFTSDVWMRASF